jgi:hypothetical protein
MLNWLKKLFVGETETKPTLEVYTPPSAKEQQKASASKPAPKPAAKKSTANTGRKTTGSKKGPKKTGVTKTDLNKMSKDDLEKYAKKEFKVDIDKRRKKADLVEEVLKLAKKNG